MSVRSKSISPHSRAEDDTRHEQEEVGNMGGTIKSVYHTSSKQVFLCLTPTSISTMTVNIILNILVKEAMRWFGQTNRNGSFVPKSLGWFSSALIGWRSSKYNLFDFLLSTTHLFLPSNAPWPKWIVKGHVTVRWDSQPLTHLIIKTFSQFSC